MDKLAQITKEYVGHELVFDPARSLTCLIFKNQVTLANLQELVELLYEDPDYNPDWDCLIDMSTAKFDLSYSDVFEYVQRISKEPRRVRGVTVIVSRSLLHYGIGRMFDSLAGDSLGTVHIERTMPRAQNRLTKLRESRMRLEEI